MSELFPWIPPDLPDEGETTVRLDPTLEVEEARRRWEVRVAQWRARHLAEAVFGGTVGARLEGVRSGALFRGLLHLDVPFGDLRNHRERERTFVACAARDPVLRRVPFVYVFNPGAR